MAWKEIMITDAGEKLLAGMVNGSKLIITKASIGAGTVPVEELSTQTDIIEPITAPALLAGQMPTEDGKGTIIKIQIRNDDVNETTRMRQVGIFAKTEHEDDVLFVILQDEIGEEIPAYDEFPQFKLEQWVTISLSRTNNITIIANPSVYTTSEEFDKLVQHVGELDCEIELIKNGSIGMVVQDIIIPAAGWKKQEGDEYSYSIDVQNDKADSESFPDIALHKSSLATAQNAELCPTVQALDGKIRFWAKNIPEADMSATMALLTKGSGTLGGSGEPYVLPIATATQLGGIKIGEGINVQSDGTASVDVPAINVVPLDKTKQMIDEVFRSKD